MLQEVCLESLQAILENFWVQRNFILSDVRSPDLLYTDIPGESFILKCPERKAASYFTLMMVSRDLTIVDCFRAPFVTRMGRDALVVDVPILTPKEGNQAVESIRLCTTHLESRSVGTALRPGQLASISTLVKGAPITKSRPIAGLVGGDMNAIGRSEHKFHKEEGVDLKDVWEDVPVPSVQALKSCEKDLRYGRARGNTWGYQINRVRSRKRRDKFLYSGSMETVALREPQDVTGKLGRLGIDLKTDVEAWEFETTVGSWVRGRYVEKLHKEYCSARSIARLRKQGRFRGDQPVRTKVNTWVSDHFGIAVGVKVL